MTPPLYAELISLGLLLLWVTIPLVIVLPIIPRLKNFNVGNRIFTAIVLAWVLGNVYNLELYHPARLQLAGYNGNLNYDGLGLNAAIIVFGWVIPAIVAVVVGALLIITTKIKNPKKKLHTN